MFSTVCKSLLEPYEVGFIMIILILQMRKLRCREAKKLAEYYIAGKEKIWDLNADKWAPATLFLPPHALSLARHKEPSS